MIRPALLAILLAGAAHAEPPEALRQSLDAMGDRFDRETIGQTFALYSGRAKAVPDLADQAYGSDPRQTLDVFRGPPGSPVVVFAHGGGFVRGDKSEVAHIGRWLAASGFTAITWNYRLAPDAHWPSGVQDQQGVLDWIAAHPELHGGDPDRVLLIGNSAGSAHVAGWVFDPARKDDFGVIGAALISPPALDLTDHVLDQARDAVYFNDPATLAEASSLKHLDASGLPIFLGLAEHDLPLVESQGAALAAGLLGTRGQLPVIATAAGHNHISIVEHLGSEGRAFGAALLAFLRLEAARAGD